MYDRSPVGLNHWLGHKMRAMLARHVFKHCGNNVKIFHGVEFSFGYNLTVEDNCTIHNTSCSMTAAKLSFTKGRPSPITPISTHMRTTSTMA